MDVFHVLNFTNGTKSRKASHMKLHHILLQDTVGVHDMLEDYLNSHREAWRRGCSVTEQL